MGLKQDSGNQWLRENRRFKLHWLPNLKKDQKTTRDWPRVHESTSPLVRIGNEKPNNHFAAVSKGSKAQHCNLM